MGLIKLPVLDRNKVLNTYMGLSITHIALHVEDLDTCIEFYQGFCELEIVHKRDSAAWLTNEALKNKFIIVLIKGGKKNKQKFKKDFSHIGIAVDSLEELFKKVKEGKKLGCYAFGPFEEDYPTGHIAGFLDPNGNLVELSYGQPIGL